ncbi:pyridoxamine 5'-phosphate oxidase family protein [Kineosporia sp. A_224]|uniref:pyridoxamine 5'-phosphate oxidase family protein n=1 Tax=Kineosporia sp. A_224 TaxID=1962180 RepID=UPI000B4B6710|nr:pyridoxamine 5'-phosphate oxidase family protein [Kineosporia sp. A_224]
MTARPLSAEDCRRLLAEAVVGRVAFTDRALPAIAAVPCRLDPAGDLLLTVPGGSRLAGAMHDAVVAFQVDDLAQGWTVTVVGEVRDVEPAGDDRTGGPRPAADDDAVVVALSIDVIQGQATGPLRQGLR